MFSNYLDYVHDTTPMLWGKLKIYLADWIDVPNRVVPIDDEERAWLCRNFTDEDHLKIFNADFRCDEIEHLL